MTNIFNFDVSKLRLRRLSRVGVVVVAVVVAIGIVAAVMGVRLYEKLTNNTIVAYFPSALALYPGDTVQIMGIAVGQIDTIEPGDGNMKVTFHYDNKYKVPADAIVTIMNPTLVASRNIQLSPSYNGGPVLADNSVIPIERTAVPIEWDDLRNEVRNILDKLGPTKEQPKGPFGEALESFATGFEGKGQQINKTLTALSDAITALNEGRGDFFGVAKSLALFVDALHKSDQQFVALNSDLSTFTNSFTHTDQELATALKDIDGLLKTAHKFVDDNGSVLAKDINNLADVTNAILQPEPRDGLETVLHVYPNLLANLQNIYHPTHGAIVAIPTIASWANPLQFMCSAIQAGSRLGYQDSAELCAQYLAPILDATKFNFPPFGVNMASTAEVLPKYVAYSESRLQPPPGYKDTTVPGIWSRDTLFSHGNHEQGWIVAPGMQGVDVQPFTANMLTPESLAELMGGPDITSIPPAGPPGGAPPNSYDNQNPAPPPWYPQQPPPPAPAPGVIPGPLPVSQQINAGVPAAPAGAPAPAGPPLPAEMGSGQ